MATPATGSGNTISQVQFYQGSTLIGTATAPTTTNGNSYSVNWTNVTANSYNVTAKATDSKNNTASSAPATVNVINNTPPTVSMTASPANATAPATIILNAVAADTDGTVTQVEFFNGSTSIAAITQAPYSTNWTNVAAGTYTLTAKATDNLGATTTSAPVPVAVTSNVPKVYDVHNDQLGTPRVITDASGNEVWRWDSAPFGETPPNEQPVNQANKFSFNMRFPGQYFDAETNLHYNYFRDYDPATGRYVESDPIGLGGGVNTFGYVGGNPVSFNDPTGLFAAPGLPSAIVAVAPAAVTTAVIWIPIAAFGAGAATYQACHPDNDEKCKKLLAEIFEAMGVVEKRLSDLYVDRYNQYNVAYDSPSSSLPKGTGSWLGHKTAAISAQNRLRNLIQEAKALGCKIPPYAWELAYAPIPDRPALPVK